MPHSFPNFENRDFLERHIKKTLSFYEPRIFAPEGGFYGCFLDDGTCFDPHVRQLVASCRYVVNYATAYRLYRKPHHLEWAKWGLSFIETAHRQDNGAYAWQIEKNVVTDSRVMAYGHAFVLLAAASSVRAGIETATKIIETTFAFLETYFWDPRAAVKFGSIMMNSGLSIWRLILIAPMIVTSPGGFSQAIKRNGQNYF